jgi:uncharacterized protein YjbI with pentapeptide repeats
MANEEQLAILKQGVDVWNRWREENRTTRIDLGGVDLCNADLSWINLSGAILIKAQLEKANLDNAELSDAVLLSAKLNGANLRDTNFSSATLSYSDFFQADFSNSALFFAQIKGANLSEANLQDVQLTEADLSTSHLSDANLTSANLENTNFNGTILYKTVFKNSTLGRTVFSNTNLENCIGLDTIDHLGPSSIGIDTVLNSTGKIPVEFLRGCGLSDIEIEFAKLANPDLTTQEVSEITHRIFELKDTRPIQISPLFISYSHANSKFVDKLEIKLNAKGIRFWRDIHDATAGRLETQIDRAIRHNPTVLLILSEHSTNSDWVEHEARLARKLEKELGRDVLCPIALDDSWKTCNWPERIKEQIMEYNILDFSNWEEDDELDVMFKRLIDGLDMFYKK